MRSYTTWTRLEPRLRDATLRDGLRATIHDPLWLLGRQWQTGELVGEDGGSLVDARLTLDVAPMARARPGRGDSPESDTVFGDGVGDPPLETLVEREQVRPGAVGTADSDDTGDSDGTDDATEAADQGRDRDVRLAAEAGAHFLRLLAPALGVDADAFPATARLTETAGDTDTARYCSVVAGRALDGDYVYETGAFDDFADFATAVAGDSPPPLPDTLDTADSDALRAYWEALTTYRAWYDDLYSQNHGERGGWNANSLSYDFSVSTGSGVDETVLRASGYEGGRLDWYDFEVDHDSGATLEPFEWDGPTSRTVSHVLVPGPATFPGMPAERWWEFEDGGVDLSAVDAAPEDLSRLLLLQFALVYGNDWFSIPVDLPVGSLSRVTGLELRTTFDDRVTVDDAVVAGDDPSVAWNLYSVGLDPASDDRGLFLAPTLVDALESDAVESVGFARDEIANVGWGVEERVEGGVGQPRDRSEEVADDPPTTPVATVDAAEADVAYQLSTAVPRNWFPLVPRQHGPGDVRLELGRLLSSDTPATAPLGEVLASTLSLPDEELTRTGATVDRQYAYTRWADGSSHLWNGHTVSVGRGGTSSGLAFDQLVDPWTEPADAAVGEPEPFPEGTPVTAAGRLELTAATFETPGGPRANLDQETVAFTNVGGGPLLLGGWTVADSADNRYTLAAETTLRPGASMTLHTGEGVDDETDRYWGRRQAVWNDEGDAVHVFDADGQLVLMRYVPSRQPDVVASPLQLAALVADPTGERTGPVDEVVVFENVGTTPLDVSGWRVRDTAGHQYTFPADTELRAGGSLRLHTGVGDDTATDRYWNRRAAVWNNTGDTLTVYDDQGRVVLRHSY